MQSQFLNRHGKIAGGFFCLLLLVLLLAPASAPTSSISVQSEGKGRFHSVLLAADYPSTLVVRTDLAQSLSVLGDDLPIELLTTSGQEQAPAGLIATLSREQGQQIINVSAGGLANIRLPLPSASRFLIVAVGTPVDLSEGRSTALPSDFSSFSQDLQMKPQASGDARSIFVIVQDASGNLLKSDSQPVIASIPLVTGIRCTDSCGAMLTTVTGPYSHGKLIGLLRLTTALSLVLTLIYEHRRKTAALKLQPEKKNRRIGMTSIVTSLVVVLAGLVLPHLDDDGSVMAISRTMGSLNNASNYFSVSAAYLPFGGITASFWSVVMSVSPRWLWIRAVLVVLLLVAYWIGVRVLANVTDHSDDFRSTTAIFSGFFLIFALSYGMTLRYESMLIPLSSLLLLSISKLHTRSFWGSPAVVSFLALFAVAVVQTGIAVTFAVFCLIVGTWKRERWSLLELTAGALLAAVVMTWNSSVPQVLERASAFASRSASHNLGLADELVRYSSGLTQSPLRRLSALIILLSLPLVFRAMRAVLNQTGVGVGTFGQKSYLYFVSTVSAIGLAFTASKWPWHFAVLSVLTAVALSIQLVDIEARCTFRERIMLAFVGALLLGVFSSGSSSRLFGATPEFAGQQAQETYVRFLNTFKSWQFGPIAIVALFTGLLLVSIPNFSERRLPKLSGSIFAFSAVVGLMTAVPLIGAAFEANSEGPVALALREIVDKSPCQIADNVKVPTVFSVDGKTMNSARLVKSIRRGAYREVATSDARSRSIRDDQVFAVYQEPLKELRLTREDDLSEFVLPVTRFATWHLLSTTFLGRPDSQELRVVLPGGTVTTKSFSVVRYKSVASLADRYRMVVDPYFYPLSPCVDPPRIVNGQFEQVRWIFGRPDVTDLGQTTSLDVGWKYAAGDVLVNFGCHQSSSVLSFYCLYDRERS